MIHNEFFAAISSTTIAFLGVLIGAATVITTCVNIYLTYRVSQTRIKIDKDSAKAEEGKSLAEMGYQAAKGEYERSERIRSEYEAQIKTILTKVSGLEGEVANLKKALLDKDEAHAQEIIVIRAEHEKQITLKDATIVRLTEKITRLEERVCIIENQEETK